MKIAVTSLGESMDSPLDQRFGRSRYFIVYNSASGQWQIHDNRGNRFAAQRAGIHAARRVADLGVSAVITGHCGPRAFEWLQSAGIAVYQDATGTVREALDAFLAGNLAQSGAANVETGHGRSEGCIPC